MKHKKHKISGFITYEKSRYAIEPTIGFLTFKPSADYWPDRIVVKEHSFEVDLPDDFDPRPQQIATLQEQQRQAQSDFAALCTDIQRKISELTCLEAL